MVWRKAGNEQEALDSEAVAVAGDQQSRSWRQADRAEEKVKRRQSSLIRAGWYGAGGGEEGAQQRGRQASQRVMCGKSSVK